MPESSQPVSYHQGVLKRALLGETARRVLSDVERLKSRQQRSPVKADLDVPRLVPAYRGTRHGTAACCSVSIRIPPQ